MNRFAGRKSEIERIFASFNSKRGTLNVIRGRRRIGKTRLIKELANQKRKIVLRYLTSIPPHAKMTDMDERIAFALQVKSVFSLSYSPPHETWMELFEFIADLCKEKNTILALDEINWLATKSPSFMSSFFYLWENKFATKKNFMVILSGSLSSWIEENIIMNKGFVGRISLDIVLRELKLGDLPTFFGGDFYRASRFDLIKMISAIGTVPRYLEELDLSKTAEQNIKNIAFTKGSFLYDEFEQMFYDLFSKKNKLYRSILATIGESRKLLTPKEVMVIVGKSYTGRDSEAFRILEEAGFIKKQVIWDLKKRNRTRSYVLKIIDNYIALYFRAIEKIKLRSLNTNLVIEPNNLSSLLGLQFENVVGNNLRFILKKLSIKTSEVIYANPFYQSSTKARKGCQVDLLIQTKRRIYVCECKLSNNEISREIIKEMKLKLDHLISLNGVTKHPVLIHANRVSESVYESNYFDEIIDMTAAFE